MRNIVASAALAVCACASPGQVRGSSAWCAAGGGSAAQRLVEDATFHPVRPELVGGALRELERSSVVPLNRARAASITNGSAQLAEASYYLVRSGIFIEPVSRDFGSARSRDTIFTLWYHDPEDATVITSQPDVPPGLIARNYPVVLQTDLELRRVYVACWG